MGIKYGPVNDPKALAWLSEFGPSAYNWATGSRPRRMPAHVYPGLPASGEHMQTMSALLLRQLRKELPESPRRQGIYEEPCVSTDWSFFAAVPWFPTLLGAPVRDTTLVRGARFSGDKVTEGQRRYGRTGVVEPSELGVFSRALKMVLQRGDAPIPRVATESRIGYATMLRGLDVKQQLGKQWLTPDTRNMLIKAVEQLVKVGEFGTTTDVKSFMIATGMSATHASGIRVQVDEPRKDADSSTKRRMAKARWTMDPGQGPDAYVQVPNNIDKQVAIELLPELLQALDEEGLAAVLMRIRLYLPCDQTMFFPVRVDSGALLHATVDRWTGTLDCEDADSCDAWAQGVSTIHGFDIENMDNTMPADVIRTYCDHAGEEAAPWLDALRRAQFCLPVISRQVYTQMASVAMAGEPGQITWDYSTGMPSGIPDTSAANKPIGLSYALSGLTQYALSNPNTELASAMRAAGELEDWWLAILSRSQNAAVRVASLGDNTMIGLYQPDPEFEDGFTKSLSYVKWADSNAFAGMNPMWFGTSVRFMPNLASYFKKWYKPERGTEPKGARNRTWQLAWHERRKYYAKHPAFPDAARIEAECFQIATGREIEEFVGPPPDLPEWQGLNVWERRFLMDQEIARWHPEAAKHIRPSLMDETFLSYPRELITGLHQSSIRRFTTV